MKNKRKIKNPSDQFSFWAILTKPLADVFRVVIPWVKSAWVISRARNSIIIKMETPTRKDGGRIETRKDFDEFYGVGGPFRDQKRDSKEVWRESRVEIVND